MAPRIETGSVMRRRSIGFRECDSRDGRRSSPAAAAGSARRPPGGWPPKGRRWSSATWTSTARDAVAGGDRRDGRSSSTSRTSPGRTPRSRRPPRRSPIDILVNNAGTDRFAFFVNTDEALWDFVLGVNLKGVLNCTHAVLPSMHERGGGVIVNVASEAGRVGSPGSVTYSAAKAGVIGFTKAIAQESARYGVRCNAVAPGPIETPLLNAAEVVYGEIGARLKQGMVDSTVDAPRGRARRGRRRDRVPRLRRRLLRDRARR